MLLSLPHADPANDEDIRELAEHLAFTPHAISRYRRQVAPDLRLGPARRQLKERVLANAVVSAAPPPWLVKTPLTSSGVTDAYIIIDDEVALPVRLDDPRGCGHPLVLTALHRHWLRPQHEPVAARAWARRRADATELATLVVFSARCVRHYCQHRQPRVSGHADLVELALAGHFIYALPAWAQRLPRKDNARLYLQCADGLLLPLRLRAEGGPLEATTCLWQDWVPTPHQRGQSSRL